MRRRGGVDVCSSSGEPDRFFAVVKDRQECVGDLFVVIAGTKGLRCCCADGRVFVAQRGDQSSADGGGLLFGDLLDRGDAGGVDFILAHVLIGGDAEAEGTEEHRSSLQCTDAGESRWAVEILADGVPGAVFEAGCGLAISVDYCDENVFSRVVVHLPERGGGSEGDLWLIVIEHIADGGGEIAVFRLSGGKDGGGAHVEIGVFHCGSDEVFCASIVAKGSESCECLDANVGVLGVLEGGGEGLPCLRCVLGDCAVEAIGGGNLCVVRYR